MSDQVAFPDLSLSVTRRLAHLRPMVTQVLAQSERKRSVATVTQYQAAVERMADRGLWPEQIGARSRRSFNLYRSALVYDAVERIREAYDMLSKPSSILSNKAAHVLALQL